MASTGRLGRFISVLLGVWLSQASHGQSLLGEPLACAQPGVAITRIQPLSGRSPLHGRELELEAVVTGVYPDLQGFFVMQPVIESQRHSSGLFVYQGRQAFAVQAGQQLRLRGKIDDYDGQTQLRVSGAYRCPRTLAVAPQPLVLPMAPADWARLSGMWIKTEQPLVVSGHYDLGRYGSLTLSPERLFAPTQLVSPGPAAKQQQARNQRQQLLLDDGSHRQNPLPVPYPQGGLSVDNPLRVGDRVEPFDGVVSYRFSQWRVHPLTTPQFKATNPRPAAPVRGQPQSLRVAAVNLQNFFIGDGQGGGFPTSRGARNAAELARQKAKLQAALSALDADLIGVMEVENNGFGADSAIAALVDLLGPSWAYLDPGTARLGSDEIMVGLLYRRDRLQPIGEPAQLQQGPFDRYSRVPLAASFRHRGSEQPITVAVNHFKAKSRCPSSSRDANADQGDGQGCWNAVRMASARQLASWLQQYPTGITEGGQLIIGDLNSYAKEQPLQLLAAAGYQNLLSGFAEQPDYSYVYQAQSGTLDYLLADSQLAKRALAAGRWAINADEPRVFSYSSRHLDAGQQARYLSTLPYRSSDHDPLWADFRLP